jgi:hypothetical protein
LNIYGELVGPNSDSLSLPILLFLLPNPAVESSASMKKENEFKKKL